MRLLVCYLNKLRNALCNDEDSYFRYNIKVETPWTAKQHVALQRGHKFGIQIRVIDF